MPCPCAGSHIAPRPRVGRFVSSVLVADCFLSQILPLLDGLPFFHLLEERRQDLRTHMQTVAFAPDTLFFWDALHLGHSEAAGRFAPPFSTGLPSSGCASFWPVLFLVQGFRSFISCVAPGLPFGPG